MNVERALHKLGIPETPENQARKTASKLGYRCIAAGPDTETWSNGVCEITGIDALMRVMNRPAASNTDLEVRP